MSELLPSERAAYRAAIAQAMVDLKLAAHNIVRLTGLLEEQSTSTRLGASHEHKVADTLRTLAWRSRHPERLNGQQAEALLCEGLSALDAMAREHQQIREEIYALAAMITGGET
jgi:hypothetical protein